MIDYHVHVSGMPLSDEYKSDVKEQLSKSLERNNITSFFGIISAGSFYTKDEVTEPKAYHFFDIDSNGLNIVKALKGCPIVSLRPDTANLDDIFKRMKNRGVELIKLFYDGEENLDEFVKKASDIDVKVMLIHTPSNFEIIEPVYELVSKMDIQLILGHGCYKSVDLVKKVMDHGFLVDTSIHPLENILYWFDNGAEDNLVFGSDWPCGLETIIDWRAQDRELEKLGELSKLFNKKIVDGNYGNIWR